MEFTIEKDFANQRADKFVRRVLNDAPLSFIYKIFRKKDVKVNGKKVDIDYKLQEGDKISIYIKEDLLNEMSSHKVVKPVKASFPVLYEDENILVANKPVGLLVHGDEDEKRMTMQNIFLNYLIKLGQYDPNNSTNYVPGPVHRLDRNTTGIVLFAKNLMAAQELLKLIREKKDIKKSYLALVAGKVSKGGSIDLPLIKDGDKGLVKVGRIEKGAKPALTLYEVKKNYKDVTLLEATLVTGRTHQLRVHFASINHPIVGDSKYGNFKINEEFEKKYGLKYQWLHAYKFEFLRVDGPLSYLSNKTFEAPLSEIEQKVLKGVE